MKYAHEDFDTAVDIVRGQQKGSLEDMMAAQDTIHKEAQRQLTGQEYTKHKKNLDKMIDIMQPRIRQEELGSEGMVRAYKKAVANKPILDGMLSEVSRASGAVPQTNLKNPLTTAEKVQRKQKEGREYTLNDVNDLSRGRLVYKDEDALKRGVEAFRQQALDHKVKIVKEENFLDNPKDTGYRGYHIDIKMPNGQTSEVQFHTVHSVASAIATHQMKSQFGDNPPDDVEGKEQQLNKLVQSLPQDKAAELAQDIETENEPAITAGQVNAQEMAKGNKNMMTPEMIRTARELAFRDKYGL